MTKKSATLFAISGILLIISVYAQFVGGSWGDKGLTIFNAQMLLEGRELYNDIFTVQPPLIDYIYLLPVYLSKNIGVIKASEWLILVTLLVITFVIYLSSKLISLNHIFNNKNKKIEFCLLLSFVLIFFNMQSYFADREHIFFVLIFPYILRWLPSIYKKESSLKIKIIVGLLAAIGFCIKPQCLVVFAYIQLINLWREKNFRILFTIENLIIYLFTIIYLTAICIFYPNYINIVMPMALATYSAASTHFFWFGILLIFAVTFSEFRLRYNSPYRQDIFYLMVLCPAFLIYVLINNGWGYTWNLLTLMALLLTGFILWEFNWLYENHYAKGELNKQFLFGIRSCWLNLFANVVIILLFITTLTFIPSCDDYFLDCKEGKEFIQSVTKANDNHPIKSFGVLSPDFVFWQQLNESTGIRWETRFNHLWMLPKFIISDAKFKENNMWIIEYVANSFADDVNKRKPDVLFVDNTGNYYSVRKKLDLISYFSIFPKFHDIMQNYMFSGNIRYCDVEEVKLFKPERNCNDVLLYKKIAPHN